MTVLFIFCQKAENKMGYYFNTGKGRVFLAEWFAGVKADFILNFCLLYTSNPIDTLTEIQL